LLFIAQPKHHLHTDLYNLYAILCCAIEAVG